MGKVVRLFRDPEKVVDMAIVRRMRRQRQVREKLAKRQRERRQ